MRYLILITFLSFIFNIQAQLSVSIQSFNDVSCAGNCDGSATALATGGTPPYNYSWNTLPVQTNATANGLCPGSYVVTVTDGLAATDTAVVVISQQNMLVVNINLTQGDTCNSCTGAATVNASGGVPPYTYMWFNGDSSQTTTTLCGGYADVLVFDALLCFGYDTLTVPIIPTASCPQYVMGLISGTVYNDVNGNCVQDAGELGLPNILVEANPGGYLTNTNANGNYGFTLPYGNYTISHPSQQYLNVLCPVSGLVNVLLDSVNDPVTNINFADSVTNSLDLIVNCYLINNISPGFVAEYFINYTSLNANPMNGTVYLVVDDSLSFISASTTPNSINGDTIFWNYTNLMQLENRSMTVNFQVPPNVNLLGDTMEACAFITPLPGDVAPANNMDCNSSVVVGSFDPNDKRVEPEGVGPTGNILLSETELTYRIRFQNTGTLYATNVVVRDTLSPNLDYTTLRNVTASHPFTYNINGNGELTFNFMNIMLPDSNVDEPGSHGAIEFTIDQNPSNSLGTVIENTAHIYFDFNPAVVTNTVMNTIVALTDVHDMVKATLNTNIYPNPASTRLFFDANLEVSSITILDVTGKVVKSAAPTNNSVSVEDLSSGIYFIRIKGNETNITQKFVKQ